MDVALAGAARVPHLIWSAIAVIIVDLASKAVVHDQLDLGDYRWLIDGIVGLERTENSGLAFGIGDGSTGMALIVVVGLAVMVWFAIRSGYAGNRVGELAIGAVIGGGLANLLDRLADGEVTDFLVVGPWPRFNVADSAVTVGILLIAILEFKAGKGFSGDGILP
jgi:signal peptidase II